MIANGKLRQTYDYHNTPRGNRFPNTQSLTILSQQDCNGKKRERAPHKAKYFRLSPKYKGATTIRYYSYVIILPQEYFLVNTFPNICSRVLSFFVEKANGFLMFFIDKPRK